MQRANEIGSEFSSKSNIHGPGLIIPEKVRDFVFTFSGRTSIETVLLNLPGIRKALLPSYCCESMLEPFHHLDISLCFYSVSYSNGLKIDLDIPNDVDLLLWCNYFGFKVDMPDLSEFINRGGVVVEDITHSFFSQKQYNIQSQYLVASLRKWEPILCGGYCASIIEEFRIIPKTLPPLEFIDQKKKAMILKEIYLQDPVDETKKTGFLMEYSKSNKWLTENYFGLMIDDESYQYLRKIDESYEQSIRIRNAKILYKGLKNNENIRMLFKEEDMDCPLFVPIVILNGKREIIASKLRLNNIYCPIHWPRPNKECKSNLYEIELSLICDQRYTELDMHRIIETVCG